MFLRMNHLDPLKFRGAASRANRREIVSQLGAIKGKSRPRSSVQLEGVTRRGEGLGLESISASGTGSSSSFSVDAAHTFSAAKRRTR